MILQCFPTKPFQFAMPRPAFIDHCSNMSRFPGFTVHYKIQKPELRGFPIARTRVYSACIRNDYCLTSDINDMDVLDRHPCFDGGALFCAPPDVVFRSITRYVLISLNIVALSIAGPAQTIIIVSIFLSRFIPPTPQRIA